MNPTTKDFQVFNEMKEMFLELGLPIVDEGHVDNYLFFASRMFIDTPSSENDLSIGYETKAKTIRIVSRLFQPVTAEKQGDLFEVFNYINCKLANVRLNIDPATQQIGLRGELALFGDPLNRKHFKEFIVLFFAAALKFFPMILDFLNGYIKKEHIMNEVDAEIKSRQEENQQSEEQVNCAKN